MSHKRKVLIVSYHFPPVGGVKIQRVVKLIKYIGEYGYEPVVLAPRGETRHSLDHESLNEVREHCQIYRAPVLDILKPLFALRNWLRGQRGTATGAEVGSSSRPQTLARRLTSWLFFPDTAILWMIPALLAGLRLIRRERIDLIFSTSPPFSSHLIACLLSRLTGKPFVTDFRDIWIQNPFVQQPSSLHRRLGVFLEKSVLKRSSGVTASTAAQLQILVDNYPQQVGDRGRAIHNGYDPADFAAPLESDDSRFTIVHGGSVLLASGREHLPLTEGMIKAQARDPDLRRDAELVFFGFMDSENLAALAAQQRQSTAADRITYLGPIPHREAINRIRAAGLLIFLSGREIDSRANQVTGVTESQTIAAKLFEYLACEKPILAVAGDCPAVRLALESGLGFWCSSYDSDRVADHLLDLYHRFHQRRETLAPNRELIESYSRREQSGEFSKVFKRALGD